MGSLGRPEIFAIRVCAAVLVFAILGCASTTVMAPHDPDRFRGAAGPSDCVRNAASDMVEGHVDDFADAFRQLFSIMTPRDRPIEAYLWKMYEALFDAGSCRTKHYGRDLVTDTTSSGSPTDGAGGHNEVAAVGSAAGLPTNADCASLYVLYQTMGGTTWIKRDGWTDQKTFEGSCCRIRAFGVGCDAANRTTSLSLPGNNLKGAIPPSIGNLTFLATL